MGVGGATEGRQQTRDQDREVRFNLATTDPEKFSMGSTQGAGKGCDRGHGMP